MLRLAVIGSLVLTAQIHVCAQASAPSPSPPLTLEAYVSELDRLAAFLSASSAAEAEERSSSLAPRWVVDTGSERVSVDARWLVEGLRSATDSGADWESSRERLRGRLLVLRAHATELAAAAAGSAHASFRSAVDDVLAGPEFRQSQTAGWRERLQQRFGEWVQSVFSRIGLGGLGGRGVAVAFAWIAGITALTGLGVWLARALSGGSGAVSFGLAPAGLRRLSAREWALRARRAFIDGNAREAVRCAYHGALRRLEEEGAWRLDRSRTPREYLRMLKPDDSRGPAVRDLTETFEQVWYANRSIDGTDANHVSANLERLGCLHPSDRAI